MSREGVLSRDNEVQSVFLRNVKREYDEASNENKLIETNSEYADLVNKIKANKDKLFDREKCREFLVPDEIGTRNEVRVGDFGIPYYEEIDYVKSWKFSEDRYNNAQKRVKEFDEKVLMLKELTEKLNGMKGFNFKVGIQRHGTKKQIKVIQKELQSDGRRIEDLKYIFAKEQAFKDTWFEDGRFVDINKELTEKSTAIYEKFQRDVVEAMYETYPELKDMDISFFGPYVAEYQKQLKANQLKPVANQEEQGTQRAN